MEAWTQHRADPEGEDDRNKGQGNPKGTFGRGSQRRLSKRLDVYPDVILYKELSGIEDGISKPIVEATVHQLKRFPLTEIRQFRVIPSTKATVPGGFQLLGSTTVKRGTRVLALDTTVTIDDAGQGQKRRSIDIKGLDNLR